MEGTIRLDEDRMEAGLKWIYIVCVDLNFFQVISEGGK